MYGLLYYLSVIGLYSSTTSCAYALPENMIAAIMHKKITVFFIYKNFKLCS